MSKAAATLTSVVVLPGDESEYAAFFGTIEYIADLLAEKLQNFPKLANFYNFENDRLQETFY